MTRAPLALTSASLPRRQRGVPKLLAAALPLGRRLWDELAAPACPTRDVAPGRRIVGTAAILGVSAGGLSLLTRVALRPEPSPLDVAATQVLQRRHTPLLGRIMTVISAPGFAPLQHVLTAGTALDLWALGYRREALFTMLTMGAGATTGVIKVAVGRPRPDPTYMRKVLQFRDKSFPSGHCTHYASFYGYVFYLAYRCMAPSGLRGAILGVCAGLIATVAPSRVYLGHHWTSDVLAGDLIGLTYLFVLIQAYETLGVRRPLAAPAGSHVSPCLCGHSS